MKNEELFVHKEIIDRAVTAVRNGGYKSVEINSMLFTNNKQIGLAIADIREQLVENTPKVMQSLLTKVGHGEAKDVLNEDEMKVYAEHLPEYNKYSAELLALESDVVLKVIDVDSLNIDMDLETDFLLRNYDK